MTYAIAMGMSVELMRLWRERDVLKVEMYPCVGEVLFFPPPKSFDHSCVRRLRRECDEISGQRFQINGVAHHILLPGHLPTRAYLESPMRHSPFHLVTQTAELLLLSSYKFNLPAPVLY